MKIKNESEIFTQDGITKIEKLRDSKFVCESCIRTKYPDGNWANQPVAIFYGKEPHPISNSRYFALFINGDNNIMVANAQSAVDEPITGVIADNEEIIYSRYRHDFRKSSDNSVFIDGGRDYVKSGIYPPERFVTLKIIDGDLVIVNKENKDA